MAAEPGCATNSTIAARLGRLYDARATNGRALNVGSYAMEVRMQRRVIRAPCDVTDVNIVCQVYRAATDYAEAEEHMSNSIQWGRYRWRTPLGAFTVVDALACYHDGADVALCTIHSHQVHSDSQLLELVIQWTRRRIEATDADACAILVDTNGH